MNKMQEHLLRAGNELGLRVITPFQLRLDSGRIFLAEALLPDLGGYPNGMIVGQSLDNYVAICAELKKLGYGLSVYGEPPPTEAYDIEGYKEMFIEWGWSGDKAKKPDWMRKANE